MVNAPVYPEEPLRQSAFTQYVIQQVDVKVIAYRLRVPTTVVREWIRVDDWNEYRTQYRAGALTAFSAQLAQYAAATAAPLIERIVQVHHLLIDQLEEKLTETRPDPNDPDAPPIPVKHSTKALKEMSGTLKDMKDVGIDSLMYAAKPDGRRTETGDGPRVQVNILQSLLDARNVTPLIRPEAELITAAASVQPVTREEMALEEAKARPAIDITALSSVSHQRAE